MNRAAWTRQLKLRRDSVRGHRAAHFNLGAGHGNDEASSNAESDSRPGERRDCGRRHFERQARRPGSPEACEEWGTEGGTEEA
jgi:hypothetical protein